MNPSFEQPAAIPASAPPVLGPRVFDIALSAILLTLLSPWLLVLALYSFGKTGSVFQHEALIGRHRQTFQGLRFAANALGSGLAVLFNILSGQMAFAGPRPLTTEEAATFAAEHDPRFAFRPGLYSPHRLRSHTGIAYEGEAVSDVAFFQAQTVRRNLGLIVRSLIAQMLAGGSAHPTPPTLHLFGIEIANTTMDETLDWMVERVKTATPSFIAFMNPDCLNIVYRHTGYRAALAQTVRILPDGIGIKLACRLLGISMKANVNGTDLFPLLCERSVREGLSLYLLGAKPGVAETVALNMQARFPGLAIAGSRDGYFEPAQTESLIESINASGADILLVAFGAPKQELWLAEHHERFAPALRLGVGGLFDFYSGRIPRAPQWMREIGLEWTWRLMQEPGRMWRRYIIGNPLFLYRIWRQKQTDTPA